MELEIADPYVEHFMVAYFEDNFDSMGSKPRMMGPYDSYDMAVKMAKEAALMMFKIEKVFKHRNFKAR